MMSSILALALAGPAAAECVAAPQPGHTGASAQRWYINGDQVTIRGKVYEKYGLPRVLYGDEVRLFAPYKGGFFYAEKSSSDPEVLYLLTRLDGCEFQPYAVKR